MTQSVSTECAQHMGCYAVTKSSCPLCVSEVMKKQIIPPFKQSDSIYMLVKKIGLDPIKDVRSIYEIEQVIKSSHNAAIEDAANVAAAYMEKRGVYGKVIYDLIREYRKEAK